MLSNAAGPSPKSVKPVGGEIDTSKSINENSVGSLGWWFWEPSIQNGVLNPKNSPQFGQLPSDSWILVISQFAQIPKFGLSVTSRRISFDTLFFDKRWKFHLYWISLKNELFYVYL